MPARPGGGKARFSADPPKFYCGGHFVASIPFRFRFLLQRGFRVLCCGLAGGPCGSSLLQLWKECFERAIAPQLRAGARCQPLQFLFIKARHPPKDRDPAHRWGM